MSVARPFAEVLASRNLLPRWLVESWVQTPPDDRIALETALQLLDDAVASSGDPDLGLHAALKAEVENPLLEYAAASCSTIRESLQTFASFVSLVNDAIQLSFEVNESTARLEFTSRVPIGRAAIDFHMAGLHLLRLRREPNLDRQHEEIFFTHAEPVNTDTYRKVFGDARLHFGAPFNGVVLPSARLDLPMGAADPKLHELLLHTIEERVTAHASRQGLTQRVRALLRGGIASADWSAERIADRLRMSRRTLSRRLAQEGSSFKALVDQTRCGLTVRYLLSDRLAIDEIAQRLGFWETASFYKAFRRWFGTTPARVSCVVAPPSQRTVEHPSAILRDEHDAVRKLRHRMQRLWVPAPWPVGARSRSPDGSHA